MNCKHFIVLCLSLTFATATKAQSAGQKPLSDFDYSRSIFKLDDEQQSNKQAYLRSAVLTGYREGVKPNTGIPYFEIYHDPTSGTAKIGIYNHSIVEMLRLTSVDPRRLILNVKDPSKYLYNPKYGDKQAWLRKNGYCFEYTVPEATVGKVSIRGTLEQVFGVKVSSETRPMKTLVLYRTSNMDKIKSRGINTGANGTIDEKGTVRTSKMSNLGTRFDAAGYPIFIDETGYTGAVDMDLNISDWKNFEEVRKALQRYDLDLKEEVRPVGDIMVVTEIN